ncbi:hypothetical protein AB0B25_25335 [Nocardia sp. NPDC049190]|uniref:hypothetical protein n=1 Tax=Nocardia sp. NPDC049190 TaxID=3155650 RepID=UPI0033C57240
MNSPSTSATNQHYRDCRIATHDRRGQPLCPNFVVTTLDEFEAWPSRDHLR